MEFFNSAVDVLQTLVIALGAGLGIWGVVNLLEGYGQDNPASNIPAFSSISKLIPSHSRTNAAAKTRKKIKRCLRITMSRLLTAAHGKRCRKSVQAQSADSLKTAKKICLQGFYTAPTAAISCITISIIRTAPLSISTVQTTGETAAPVMKRTTFVPIRWNRLSFWN